MFCDRFQKHMGAVSETDDKEEKLFKLRPPTFQTLESVFMVLDYIYRDNQRFMNDYRSGPAPSQFTPGELDMHGAMKSCHLTVFCSLGGVFVEIGMFKMSVNVLCPHSWLCVSELSC